MPSRSIKTSLPFAVVGYLWYDSLLVIWPIVLIRRTERALWRYVRCVSSLFGCPPRLACLCFLFFGLSFSPVASCPPSHYWGMYHGGHQCRARASSDCTRRGVAASYCRLSFFSIASDFHFRYVSRHITQNALRTPCFAGPSTSAVRDRRQGSIKRMF